MPRCGLDEDDDIENEQASMQSLIQDRVGTPRSIFLWEGASAYIRNIAGAQKYEPLEKVKRLRDFAVSLSEHYKPAEDESCCGKFKGCLAYVWSLTGQLEFRNNFITRLPLLLRPS